MLTDVLGNPEHQFDEDLCKCHALFVVGKVLRNLRSHLNRQYAQEGKIPYKDYNFITREVWEEFVEKMSTDEAKCDIPALLSGPVGQIE